MKRTCAIIALVGLASCATPATRVEVKEVLIPTAIQPITASQVPALPSPLPPRPTSLSAAADTLLAKVCEWVAFGLKADPLLKVSAGVKPSEAVRFPECEK